ncbi:hypothetical protein CBS101457_004780 [Exobasidium rhododendri]|nr:hypothetical protein CBS101457_004780 [Exobasidium rhododendri]
MMDEGNSNSQSLDQQHSTTDQQDEQQRSLQHPHLPSNLVAVSDQQVNPILQAAMDVTANLPVEAEQDQEGQQQQQLLQEDPSQLKEEEQQTVIQAQEQGESGTQDYTDQADQNAANFFDQSYQQYEFPTSSTTASNTPVTSFPFHPHPHPQHPHLGVEALGHAAAASQHTGRVNVPGLNAPEGDGGNHSYSNNGNGVDHSMDMTMSSTTGETTNASMDQSGQQERSSGKAPRTSLSVPGSDESGTKKETPYSRSPDMRNSHKLAERKRRKEMKDLFDDLRDQLPVDRGPKTSKWEILSKAVDHIKEICKERDAYASELHALRGGGVVVGGEDELGQQMTGVEDGGVAPPPPAPEDDIVGSDEYAKYEQQQVTSQQQVEAAAAAANQFNAHHDYSQPTHEEQLGQSEIEYKSQQEFKIPEEQPVHDIVDHEQPVEQDWTAIAAQAAEAQQAQ